MNPFPQWISNLRAFSAGLVDDAAEQSRYAALLCLIGGLVMLVPAWHAVSTGKGRVTVAGSSRVGGATTHPPDGPGVRVQGLAIGAFATLLATAGVRTLLSRRSKKHLADRG